MHSLPREEQLSDCGEDPSESENARVDNSLSTLPTLQASSATAASFLWFFETGNESYGFALRALPLDVSAAKHASQRSTSHSSQLCTRVPVIICWLQILQQSLVEAA